MEKSPNVKTNGKRLILSHFKVTFLKFKIKKKTLKFRWEYWNLIVKRRKIRLT